MHNILSRSFIIRENYSSELLFRLNKHFVVDDHLKIQLDMQEKEACSLLNSNRIKQSYNHVTIRDSVNDRSIHELFDFVGEMVASVCGLLLRSGIRRLRNVGSVFR